MNRFFAAMMWCACVFGVFVVVRGASQIIFNAPWANMRTDHGRWTVIRRFSGKRREMSSLSYRVRKICGVMDRNVTGLVHACSRPKH